MLIYTLTPGMYPLAQPQRQRTLFKFQYTNQKRYVVFMHNLPEGCRSHLLTQ